MRLFFAKVKEKANLSNDNEMLNNCKNLGNYFCVKSFRLTFAPYF